MTTTVDANNSAGFKVTADTSGILQLQTNSTAALTVDASQNVGIGTSSPGAILHTVKTSSGASTVGAFLQNSSSTTSTEVRLAFAANANSLFDNRYGWVGYVNTGGTNGGALTFATTPGGTPATERMRIDSSGNVGIGTASPGQKLEVNNGAADVTVLAKATGANYASFRVTNSSRDYSMQIRTDVSNAWVLRDETGGANRLVVDTSGNVGIGTTPVAFSNSVGVQVGTNTIVQQVVSNQSMLSANAYYAGSWKAAASVTGFAAVRLNATSPGAISFHGNSSSYTAGDSLPNMDGSDLKMTINPNGIVFINTTTDNTAFLNINHEGTTRYALSCNNTNTGSSSQIAIRFNRGTSYTQVGTITTTNAATSYASGSDYRLKDNVQPMTGALAKVALLKPVTFNWTIDGSNGQGFIAHELQEVCPDAVTGSKDAVDENGKPEYQGVDTSFLVATLTAAIQELKALVDAQASTITQLQADVAALKGA